MASKKFSQGSVLINEGETASTMFILLSGKLGVFKGDMKISEFNEKGVIVGEMSSLLSEKRTATIKALEDCLVMELKAGIDELLSDYPEIAKKIMINLAQRLKKTTDEYWLIATELSQQSLKLFEKENE